MNRVLVVRAIGSIEDKLFVGIRGKLLNSREDRLRGALIARRTFRLADRDGTR